MNARTQLLEDVGLTEEFSCERCNVTLHTEDDPEGTGVFYADEDVDGTYFGWVCEECAENMDSDKVEGN